MPSGAMLRVIGAITMRLGSVSLGDVERLEQDVGGGHAELRGDVPTNVARRAARSSGV